MKSDSMEYGWLNKIRYKKSIQKKKTGWKSIVRINEINRLLLVFRFFPFFSLLLSTLFFHNCHFRNGFEFLHMWKMELFRTASNSNLRWDKHINTRRFGCCTSKSMCVCVLFTLLCCRMNVESDSWIITPPTLSWRDVMIHRVTFVWIKFSCSQ